MPTQTKTTPGEELDAVVVGAGFSGIYMLKRLRDAGFAARGYEAGKDVGGTWYWNRYPGAGSDSDSTVYCFSDLFSEELLREWEWSERYPKQQEIHRYLRWVTDKLGLRKDIECNTRVTTAIYDDSRTRWDITTETGKRVSARYFIPATGALSKPLIPNFPGLGSFQGECYHTARLPEQGLDYTNKRVAVIGSGATAVQIVPEVAKVAAFVWEFQRHPYHSIPARNHKLDKEDWQDIHACHKEIWEQARHTFGGFPYKDLDFDRVSHAFSPREQRRILEEAWLKGGFFLLFSGFADVFLDREANRLYTDFLREKIAQIVHDPIIAAKLTPTELFGTKRPPLEHGYYAAFNRDNVGLVDMRETPIASITPKGIRTSAREYEVDIILLATGFDAYTGTLLDMDIQGREGRRLQDKWSRTIEDYLGLMVHGFPNMFMLYNGPYNPAALVNGPTLIEQQGDWILTCLQYLRQNNVATIEPRQEAEQRFVALHQGIAEATLIPQTASWWTGTNVEGKQRTMLSWCGGFPGYKDLCDAATASNYAECLLETNPD